MMGKGRERGGSEGEIKKEGWREIEIKREEDI